MADEKIDPTKITEPKRDASGGWVYPAAWPAAARESWAAMVAEAEAEDRRAGLARAKLEADASTPEAMLIAARTKVEAARLDRERAEQAVLDEAAWRAAITQYPENRLMRIPTERGLLILRPMTGLEVDVANERARNLERELEKLSIHRRALRDTVLHPAKPSDGKPDRFDQILADFPGLWETLYQARDALIIGLRLDAGKDAAL